MPFELLSSVSALWNTSPRNRLLPPNPLAELFSVPPTLTRLAVAGVGGMSPLSIPRSRGVIVQPGPCADAADSGLAEDGIAVGRADVGIVACAAGPRAADKGVAGSGEVSGDGPWSRSSPGNAVADGIDEAESGA